MLNATFNPLYPAKSTIVSHRKDVRRLRDGAGSRWMIHEPSLPDHREFQPPCSSLMMERRGEEVLQDALARAKGERVKLAEEGEGGVWDARAWSLWNCGRGEGRERKMGYLTG